MGEILALPLLKNEISYGFYEEIKLLLNTKPIEYEKEVAKKGALFFMREAQSREIKSNELFLEIIIEVCEFIEKSSFLKIMIPLMEELKDEKYDNYIEEVKKKKEEEKKEWAKKDEEEKEKEQKEMFDKLGVDFFFFSDEFSNFESDAKDYIDNLSQIYNFFFGGYDGYKNESSFLDALNNIFFDFYGISTNFEAGNIKMLYDYYKKLENSLKNKESRELIHFFIFYFDVEFAIINIKTFEANIFKSNKEITEILLPLIITFFKYKNFDFILEYIIYFCQKLRKNLFIQILFPILEGLKKSEIKEFKKIELNSKYEEYAKEHFEYHFKDLDLTQNSSEIEYFQNLFDLCLNILFEENYKKDYQILAYIQGINGLEELSEYYNKLQSNLPYTKEIMKYFFYLQYIVKYDKKIEKDDLAEKLYKNRENKMLCLIKEKKDKIKINKLYFKKGDKGEEELSSFNIMKTKKLSSTEGSGVNIFLCKNLFSQKQIVLVEIKHYIKYKIASVTLEEFKATINNNLKEAFELNQKYESLEIYCFFNYFKFDRCLTLEKAYSLFPDINKELNKWEFPDESLLRIITEEENNEDNFDKE